MGAGDPHLETAMKNVLRLTICGGAALVGIACAEIGSPTAFAGVSRAAFESVPAGFSSVNSTFDASGDLDGPFMPHVGDGSFDDHGRGGQPWFGDDHGRGGGPGGGARGG